MAIAIGRTGSSPDPPPPQCASPPATDMQLLFYCLNVSIFF